MRRRVLMLANVVPFPAVGGVHLRLLHLARRIAARHHLTLLCHSWCKEEDEAAAELTRQGIRTCTGRVVSWPGWRETAGALASMARGRPPELAMYRSPGVIGHLRRLLREEPFDLLHVEETLLTHYLDFVPRDCDIRRLLTLHNVHFEQAARIAAFEPERWRRTWRRCNARWMRFYEPSAAGRFHRIITVTGHDRDLLLSARPGLAVDVVPNGVDIQELRALSEPSGPPALVFVGSMGYTPCDDAATWLVHEILPLIHRRHPGLAVWIVGRSPSARVRALAGGAVHVTGAVPDVVPYYDRATIAVVPLRSGGGSRLKILEAMALGRPVVSTTIGAEGLAVEPEEHLLLADTAEAFAAAVERLLDQAALRRRLTVAARRLVEEHYGWDHIAALQLDIYDRLLGAHSQGESRGTM